MAGGSAQEQTPQTTLVIPMWNEAARIASTVERIASSPLATDLELLLVDDGSTDGTRELARSALEQHGIDGAVIVGGARRGKGRAVQLGARRATGSVVAYADADLSADPEEIRRIVDAVRSGRAEVVVANRRHPDSEIVVVPPWQRRAAARAFNLSARALGLTDRADTQCGLKAFTSAAARLLFEDLVAVGFAFDVEILLRAERAGLGIREEPVRWSHDRETSVRMVRHAPATASDLLRIRRRYGSSRRPRRTT